MDITLKRILELIPKNENGVFVHGAKKQFAESIGLRSGNLIADWESGRSVSYKNYVYEISEKYGVSVSYLLGETDEKEKPLPYVEGAEEERMIREIMSLDKEDYRRVLDFVAGLKAARKA